MSDVTITLFSDPLSVRAYRRRAVRSQLRYAFDDVDLRYRCVVSIPERSNASGDATGDDPGERDGTDDGDETAARAEALSELRAAGTMPVADLVSAEGLPPSWAACEAIVAARAQGGGGAAFDLARTLADRVFASGESIATPDEIREAAASVAGLDPERVADAVGTRRATAAVGRDLERARQTVESLPEVDVRGTPETVPLGSRSYLDGVPEGPNAQAGPEADGAAAAEDGEAPDSDADGEGSEATPSTDEVFRAPVYRVDGPTGATVVDGAAGFDALRDAIRRFDPDLGDTGETTETQSRNVMQQYGAAPMNAESFGPEDHESRALDVLATLPSAFTAEVRACLDVTDETCRIALHRLKRDGRVRRATTGAWVRVPEE
ncbi:hypothetical protein [Halobellus rufus]|uniref:hypothetical protein n=1 Tax=Halobellus rufus TaxID=1448860 RepID=UPI000679953F|nr:hypothetical protein [Halobellus rufus]